MNAVQKAKHFILIAASDLYNIVLPEITAENIDDVYEEMCTNEEDAIQDGKQEVRCNVYETSITPKQFSRHYEIYIGAAEYIDGSYIAWPVYHGGGKFGEPDYACDWWEYAFDVDMKEETIVVKKFTEKNDEV